MGKWSSETGGDFRNIAQWIDVGFSSQSPLVEDKQWKKAFKQDHESNQMIVVVNSSWTVTDVCEACQPLIASCSHTLKMTVSDLCCLYVS